MPTSAITQKPRVRRFLEALTIVGSILVAFSVDAWWEDRQERQRAGALIDMLRVNVAQQMDELRYHNARADSVLAAIDELSAVASGALEVETDSLTRLVNGGVWKAASFRPSVSAFEVARGSDAWDRLPPHVSAEIADYLQGYQSFDIQVQVIAFAGLIEVAARHGGPRALADGTALRSDYTGLVSDPEFAAWLWTHQTVIQLEQGWRALWLDRLGALSQRLEAL